jgi:chemotaxis protein CheC
MISVPHIAVAAIDEVPNQIADKEEPVAAILMKMEGDLDGLTLLVFPQPIALRVAGLMMHRQVSSLGKIEESALKEAGNILSAAYLNALAEFLRLRLLNSPPEFTLDMSDAVLSSTYIEMAAGGEYVFCVESEFLLHGETSPLRGFFLLLPDPPSLQKILQLMRLA